jgi:hypothetical protein
MKKRRILIQVYSDFESLEYLDQLKNLNLYIGNLFEFYLPEFYTNIKKIVIELVNDKNYSLVIPKDLTLEVCTIRKSFDFLKFDLLNTEFKKELLFEFTFNCLNEVFEKLNFDLIELRDTKERIIKNKFHFEVNLCNTPLSSKLNTTATLIAEHYIEFALISLVIYKDNFEKKIPLFKSIPHYFMYSQVINKVMWLSNDVVQLLNKEKDFIINISLGETITCLYRSDSREMEDIKSELKFLTQEILFEI